MLFFHLFFGLDSDYFPWDFLHFSVSSLHANRLIHTILLDIITLKSLGDEYKLWSFQITVLTWVLVKFFSLFSELKN
jgi:hypothetical protein